MEDSAFVPSLVLVLPFVTLLLGIAILPLVAPHFWESNFRKLIVSALLGLPVVAIYLQQQPETVLHTASDYVSFIVLLGCLFIISGGVFMEGDLEATPAVNTGFLALGALLASAIGTTGASMLLIRPILQTNSERRRVAHTIVFFIFLVSNIGGCLTPLGDPPLFLGYLQGVPFSWTLRLAPAWLFTSAIVLVIYFVWESCEHAKESPVRARADRISKQPLTLRGRENLLLLACLILVTAFMPAPWRELTLVILAAFSLLSTPRSLREANHFSFQPIVEVAAIFAGIFMTMMPALDLLHLRGAELGVREPWQYFWATGALSSFLDNAPTYLTFLALAQAQGMTPEVVGVPHEILTAISLGAVFMGANSYIGNGPNFMVRSIAEDRGVSMPSFGGYLLYSGAVLIPVFVLVTVVFF